MRSMLTADTNLVEVKSAVQYTQPDPLKYLFKVQRRRGDPDSGQRERDARGGRAGLARQGAGLRSVDHRPRHACCCSERSITTTWAFASSASTSTDVNVPEAVQDAQRDAIKADKDRQRYQQDAETYRNDVRAAGARRRPPRKSWTPKPTGCRCWRWRRAKPRASIRFLAQYEHAPAVTRERMYLDTMENVYKNSRKVIVDTKNGNNMMYLPLDKLIAAGPQSISMPNDTMTVAPARCRKCRCRRPKIRRARAGVR